MEVEAEEQADPVPELTRRHFEFALLHARKSNTQGDMSKYESFRSKYDPTKFGRRDNTGERKLDLQWPEEGGHTNITTVLQTADDDDDDDLYS